MIPETISDEITDTSLEKKVGGDVELEAEPPRPKSLKFKLTVQFLAIVTLIASMDAVIVGSCLVAIAEDLQSSSVESFWVGTSFLLAQTVTIPPYGTTSEIFSRKGPIIIATAIFTFGSILCATAQNGGWLIGARVVQGIGAGGMIQLVQVILSDISTTGKTPPQPRLESHVAEIAYQMIRKFPSPVQHEYRWVYARILTTMWYVMMGLSIVGFVVSLIARNDEIKGGLSGTQNFQDGTKPADEEAREGPETCG
ncbi:MFS general substrate transporter [Aspergillus affinis]|uniref:MFS general substrate transporter n=1 Tax=Aspergillus affinis TaxID=1070780 RepID=UPI0022FE9911|nr:MFS general substrate transporter [Aspergillus affinis]KAI9038312.1 MFS general substrate transporter [Aspergillus affinis]